jgi:hypothetical protein
MDEESVDAPQPPTKSQRALAAARHYLDEKKANPRSRLSLIEISREHGIEQAYIGLGLLILDHCSPDEVRAIEDGTKTLLDLEETAQRRRKQARVPMQRPIGTGRALTVAAPGRLSAPDGAPTTF